MTIISNFALRNAGTTLFQAMPRCILALLLIGQIGCVAPSVGQDYQGFPILYGILAEDQANGASEYRIATAQEWRRIRIMRRGAPLDATPNMALQTGDSIKTGSGVAAAIRFPNGSQLYVKSNSHIRIGSVFALVGELFVRVKGSFQVDTEFVTAGAEGTEWVMTVWPNGDTRCIVLEGHSRMASNQQRWKSILVGTNSQMVTRGAEYQQVTSASAEDIRQIRLWVSQIDRLTRQPEPRSSDDNRSLPFSIQFNSYRRHDRDMRGDKPDRTDTNRNPYPQ